MLKKIAKEQFMDLGHQKEKILKIIKEKLEKLHSYL